MAEPSEDTYRHAIASHCCGCATINRPTDEVCIICGRPRVHRSFMASCRATEYDAMLARAIASAREQSCDRCHCCGHDGNEPCGGCASAREEGKREGLEEALARFEAIKAEHRATAAGLRGTDPGDRSAWFWDEEARKADDAADVVRALIGGAP